MRYLFSILLVPLVFAIFPVKLSADEGMWLPVLISERIDDMKAKGFRLDAEDIYSINQASLKDAVVLFNGGCTGELISNQGLLLTNHHCGYGAIQCHSSVEHDYLKDGFWAMSLDEELPNDGLWVSFLIRMEDVTDAVLQGYDSSMDEARRDSLVKANSAAIEARAMAEGPSYQASVESMYYGNQYFLFVYQKFDDVRLVGAPPSSVGKFGGDTDNWMWPRHTGDFSIFRIYADKDNNPAAYSEDNVPYRPKKFFKISTAGVNEGDFTFVYGFPGSTQEYVHSDAIGYIEEMNPKKIALRDGRLEIMKKYMSADQDVRIRYSSKQANVANAWKKWQGELKGLIKLETRSVKKESEKAFTEWALSGGHDEYAGVIEELSRLYAQVRPYSYAMDYYVESLNGVDAFRFAMNVGRYIGLNGTEGLADYAEAFFKDYYYPIDEEIFIFTADRFMEDVPDEFKPEYLKEEFTRLGSTAAVADSVFAVSIFTDREKTLALAALDSAKAMEAVASDPLYRLADSFYAEYAALSGPAMEINRRIALMNRTYMRGQMEFDSEKAFYPDANLTLRVSYGEVAGFEPSDGIEYLPVSTLEGIIEKDNPDIFDYDIPQKLRDLYAAKDYGRWETEGTVPVCFLATNHTSGGNSGSPVINADGNLVGVNFDRVWEGTMSDLDFDPELCRNISLDIRYVLFIIDKYAGARNLMDELVFAD